MDKKNTFIIKDKGVFKLLLVLIIQALLQDFLKTF